MRGILALLIIAAGAAGAILTGRSGVFSLIVVIALYLILFRPSFRRLREKKIVLQRLKKVESGSPVH